MLQKCFSKVTEGEPLLYDHGKAQPWLSITAEKGMNTKPRTSEKKAGKRKA